MSLFCVCLHLLLELPFTCPILWNHSKGVQKSIGLYLCVMKQVPMVTHNFICNPCICFWAFTDLSNQFVLRISERWHSLLYQFLFIHLLHEGSVWVICTNTFKLTSKITCASNITYEGIEMWNLIVDTKFCFSWLTIWQPPEITWKRSWGCDPNLGMNG